MKTRNIAIIAVAALLLATTAVSTTNPNAFATYKRNQATSQTSDCGNEFMSINIGCQNTGSQVQGDENTVALAAQQTFPQVEREQKDHNRPVPPPEVGCPENTVWDITIREEASQGSSVPVGTVICLFQGLGNHPAEVHEPGVNPFTADVITNQPNAANCNGPSQQLAQVTSGDPPRPLEMGSFLCAAVFRG